MEDFLKAELIKTLKLEEGEAVFRYSENVNPDALSDIWLSRGTSWIYKVAVMAAIDSNKCDWVHIIIAKANEHGNIDVIGRLDFAGGENDDIGFVLDRSMSLIKGLHSVFND